MMLSAGGRARRAGALALLAALPDAAALLDEAGVVLGSNAACRALLGPALPPAGQPAELWFHPADRPALRAALAAGGQLMLRLADGSEDAASLPVLLAPLPGRPALLLLRLAPPRDVAEERLALLGRMAGGIAHDFNNLLAIIRASARRMLEDPQAAEGEYAVLEQAADRGAALIRQLLAFARRQVLQPALLEPDRRIRELAPLIERLLGPGIALELALDQPGRMVRVDPAEFDRVLLNLAANAREAMGGRGRLVIGTGARLVLRQVPGGPAPGRYLQIRVQDSGPGIPPELLPRLFEPFFTTRAEKGGSGLGLATVQGIIAQSGGHVSAANAPEGGACFTLLLPRSEGEPPAGPARPAGARASAARPARILLVEDEPALLRLSRLALEGAGHEVLPAEDAEAALELLRQGALPELLVSDLALPGMDGIALARAARALRPGLAVLLLSGYAEAAVGLDWAREGWHYLAKPWTPEGLRRAVAAALDKPAAHEQDQNGLDTRG
ncbi:MAG: ATP-binding protein [Rhodovarius sp.]|nr:ATP-binding protein [Rhodovarius sp.]MDW8314220.1 ATP-binding protein [Rhodovarius sp.]